KEDDILLRLRQVDPRPREAGPRAQRVRHRGEDVTQRAFAVRRRDELGRAGGHRAAGPWSCRAPVRTTGAPPVLAWVSPDSVSANSSSRATASGPSAAALMRIEKSSEASTPV